MLQILDWQSEGFDLDAVKALFREYEAYLVEQLDFQDFSCELVAMEEKYGQPHGNLYLACWNNEPVGCGAFRDLGNNICELKRMYVKPSAQGKGVGQALLERAMKDATERGYARMRLDSIRRLAAAQRMYERYGFYEIPPYNTNSNYDVYYMERALPAAVKS